MIQTDATTTPATRMKQCRDCKEIKPLEQMQKHKLFKDGHNTLCLLCNQARVKAWRALGKRDSAGESKRYYDRHPEKCMARMRKYQTGKHKRYPAWADSIAIEAVYKEAVELSKHTGIPHDVDHIVPLHGKNVSGLHVHHNLRVIPATDNRRKSNKFEGY